MGRRALNQNNIHKLTKTGGGKYISVTIPIEMVRELKWREIQKAVVKRSKFMYK